MGLGLGVNPARQRLGIQRWNALTPLPEGERTTKGVLTLTLSQREGEQSENSSHLKRRKESRNRVQRTGALGFSPVQAQRTQGLRFQCEWRPGRRIQAWKEYSTCSVETRVTPHPAIQQEWRPSPPATSTTTSLAERTMGTITSSRDSSIQAGQVRLP